MTSFDDSTPTFELTSTFRADTEELWQSATSLAGINGELMPLLRMRPPRGLANLADVSAALATPAQTISSWLLIAGFLPFDRQRMHALEVEGHWFRERSSTWWLSSWQHQRELAELPGGCSLTDRVWVAARVPFGAPMVRWFVRTLFRHRHRRLRARYGEL